ncbi:MAG: hypothetical protein JW709_13015 [Sedimentisphaerales bacterium]|nr:hypothetical protein [Sedimentisphaerales bacterium]
MILALLLIPTLAAVLSLLVRHDVLRRMILIIAVAGHTGVTLAAWIHEPAPLHNGWFALDKLGLLFLTITSILFLTCAFYAVGYLSGESRRKTSDAGDDTLFPNTPEAIFCACLNAFLATMTLVMVSHHFGVLWVAMEATTLATATLIYFHRNRHSLEATWKYLLICSVGIALALLGNYFLVIAASTSEKTAIILSDLVRQGHTLNAPWLKAAFLLFLVGYGVKMGLAPLHTWLPDAHSEAPSVISALLSGTLLNCAFLGILRSYQVCCAAELASFCQELFVIFGLLSMGWAAVYILGQPDYKRMLAYSSVEHIGILALGVGIGAGATFGAMLHAVNHSLVKVTLFLAAGNILAAYKTKTAANVKGLLSCIPATGVLWVAGFLAITGVPPFGIFLSEFTIVKAILDQGHMGVAIAFLGILALIFIGMAMTFLNMAQGRRSEELCINHKTDSILTIIPPASLGILSLMLGLYLPPMLSRLLHDAATAIGGF